MSAKQTPHGAACTANEPLGSRLSRSGTNHPRDVRLMLNNCVVGWARFHHNVRSTHRLDRLDARISLGVICQDIFHAGMRPSDWHNVFDMNRKAAQYDGFVPVHVRRVEYWYDDAARIFEQHGIFVMNPVETELPCAQRSLCVRVDADTQKIACIAHTYCNVNSVPSFAHRYDMNVSAAYVETVVPLQERLTQPPDGWCYARELQIWRFRPKGASNWIVQMQIARSDTHATYELDVRPADCSFAVEALAPLGNTVYAHLLSHVNAVGGQRREFAPHDPAQVLADCQLATYADTQRLIAALNSAMSLRAWKGAPMRPLTRDMLGTGLRDVHVMPHFLGTRAVLFVSPDAGLQVMGYDDSDVRHASVCPEIVACISEARRGLCCAGLTIIDGDFVDNLHPHARAPIAFVASQLLQADGCPMVQRPPAENARALRECVERINAALARVPRMPFTVEANLVVDSLNFYQIVAKTKAAGTMRICKIADTVLGETVGMRIVRGPRDHCLWVPPARISVDLVGVATEPGSATLTLLARDSVPVGTLTLSDAQMVDLTRVHLDNELIRRSGCAACHTVLECGMDYAAQRWTLVRIATAKTLPMTAEEAFGVLMRAMQPIAYSELLGHFRALCL